MAEHWSDVRSELSRGLALCLVVASGFVVVAALVRPLGSSGTSARDRVFEACQMLGILPASLALAAVALTALSRNRLDESLRASSRRVVRGAAIIGVLIAAAALYSAAYLLLVHQRFPSTFATETFVGFATVRWAWRISGVLDALAAGLIGATTIVVARRGSRALPPPAEPLPT
jgi:hypothetical protein